MILQFPKPAKKRTPRKKKPKQYEQLSSGIAAIEGMFVINGEVSDDIGLCLQTLKLAYCEMRDRQEGR